MIKRKILFITPTLRSGGAEKNMVNIANSLDPGKFDVQLAVCGGEDNYGRLLSPSVHVERFKKKGVIRASVKLIVYMLKEKPDIVFTSAEHLSMLATFVKILFSCNYINVARIPTLPGNRLGTNWKSKILYRFNPLIFGLTDIIVSQSAQMTKEISEIFQVPVVKIVTIFNLINVRQIEKLKNEKTEVYGKNDFNIVSVGALYPVKGFDILIKALSMVQAEIPNIKLHILGMETVVKGYRKKLETLAGQLGLSGKVVFHGFVPNPYPYMKEADLFVLSSRKEGFPNVVLESLVTGTPVVATDCVDLSGIISDGVNGYVVEKENVAALAAGIVKGSMLESQNFEYDNFDFNGWFTGLLDKK